MRVWSIANQKGGVGKTTTTVSLAGFLAQKGWRTLVIDLDPHGSLTSYFGYDPDTIEQNIFTLFQKPKTPLASLVLTTSFENISLVPSTLALATVDRQLGARSGMGLVLAKALQHAKSQYDCALIDCPPMLGVPMVNALAACDHLVIPVQTEYLALHGLERMIRTLQMITRSRKEPLTYTVVPTLFDKRTRASLQSLVTLKARNGTYLSNTVIPVDTLFRDASQAGAPISIKAPRSRGAIAYGELVEELLRVSGVNQSAVA